MLLTCRVDYENCCTVSTDIMLVLTLAFTEELDKVEAKVYNIIAEANRNKVVENFNILKNSAGSTNTSGVWKMIRKIYPKNKESLPFAKKDFQGKLISSQKELKCLYLDTFKNRLRNRPTKARI